MIRGAPPHANNMKNSIESILLVKACQIFSRVLVVNVMFEVISIFNFHNNSLELYWVSFVKVRL